MPVPQILWWQGGGLKTQQQVHLAAAKGTQKKSKHVKVRKCMIKVPKQIPFWCGDDMRGKCSLKVNLIYSGTASIKMSIVINGYWMTSM